MQFNHFGRTKVRKNIKDKSHMTKVKSKKVKVKSEEKASSLILLKLRQEFFQVLRFRQLNIQYFLFLEKVLL